MIVDIILIVLLWEYVASLVTAAVVLKSIKISEINVEKMQYWIENNPKKAIVLSILNLPLLLVSPLFCLIFCKKPK